MSYASPIEWTEGTWNPVTGCTKISPGCKFCYAERLSERFRGIPGHPFEQGFDLRLHQERVSQPLRWKRPRIIFVNSMSDLFHERIPTEYIQHIFQVMREAGQHTFQVLTKRPERLLELCNSYIDHVPKNVWLGVSVENEKYTWRIDYLRQLNASIRFLSCEPLLGPLDLNLDGIHWVIVGGESGPGARVMRVDWVRPIRDQCRERKVPFFFKQWGGVNKKRTGRTLDGRTWDEMPDIS
ncbi:MAG: phage Gp37/Gp68 family protein [Acidobacteria bacterium]|nr:phage Gp37/Gp68 family protein [Acidobacteriota bacterium]